MCHLTDDCVGLDYWSYSFTAYGAYDIPAVLDYVSNETSEDKVSLIGNSMGTTATFYGLQDATLKSFYDARLRSFTALAPVVRMNNIWRALRYVAYYTYHIQEYIEDKMWTHINQDGEIIDSNGDVYVFEEYSWWDYYWGNVDATLELIAEWVADWVDECYNDVSYYYDNERTYETIADIPLKTSIHYSQIIKERQFQDYNYIEDAENFAEYGTNDPPAFDVSNVDTTPIMLVSAHADPLSSYWDVMWLYDTLVPNYAGDDDSEVILVNIEGKHASALQGQDMSYFSDTVLPWVASFLPSEAA